MRCRGLIGILALLALGSAGAPSLLEASEQQTSHLLDIDTPDKGYWNLPVRITDRSTAEALSFDPERDGPATISYRLTRDGLVRVRVVRRSDPGLVLRTLVDWSHQDFGHHSVTWDGRDASGNPVDTRGAFVTFEGDDPAHRDHPRSACHEPALEILEPAAGSHLRDLSSVRARITRSTPFGRARGFTLRCYVDYALRGEAALDGDTHEFFLPCTATQVAGDHLLTLNLDDDGGHVGVAGLRFHYGGGEPADESGRVLFAQLGCAGCHDLDSATWTEDGPGLRHIGSRRPGDYLRRVIEAPRSVNRTSQMPEEVLPEESVTTLVQYLSSLQRPSAPPRTGAEIYREEGCADCHEAEGALGAMAGPFLRGIGRLRTVAYLESVVLRPDASFAQTAMPPTRLSPRELANLVEYLQQM